MQLMDEEREQDNLTTIGFHGTVEKKKSAEHKGSTQSIIQVSRRYI